MQPDRPSKSSAEACPACRRWVSACLLVPYVYLSVFAALAVGGITVMRDGTGFFYALYLPVWGDLAPHDLAPSAVRWLLPLGVLLLLAAGVQALGRGRGLPPGADWGVVAGLSLFLFTFACLVAMMRGGVLGIAGAYLRTGTEFTGDLSHFSSLYDIFHNYLARHADLTLHARAYPPGVVAVLHVAATLLGWKALTLSLFTVGVGASAVFPLYLWVRSVAGRSVALLACALYTVMPSIVLFTATSTNALFMPVIFLMLAVFQRALDGGRAAMAVLAGGLYGLLSLLSFNHLALGAWFALAALWQLRREGAVGRVSRLAVLMTVGFLAVHILVRVWSGFDILQCFGLARRYLDGCLAGLAGGTRLPLPWVWRILINPAVVLFYAGVPVSVLCAFEVARGGGWHGLGPRCAVMFAVLCLLYLAWGEAERAAMYMLPFLLLPAALMLRRLQEREGVRPVIGALLLLGLQTWATELVLYTYW